MRRVVVVFLSLVGAVVASAQDAKETVYSMVVADDVRAMCRQLGVVEPTGRLVLKSDSTFKLETGLATSSGRFAVSKSSLALAFDGPATKPISIAEMGSDFVSLDGIRYERLAASFKPGTWTLRRNGSENRTISFRFDPSGQFAFAGMEGTSKGSWKVEDDGLLLVWSEIDGKPVEKGLVVRKRVPLGSGYFQIDQYRYERADR